MVLPRIYKQAAFKGSGEPLTLEDVPLQLPGEYQLFIKVEACGV